VSVALGDPVDARIPWVRAIHDFDDARRIASPGPKLEEMRRIAERFGEELRRRPRVAAVRTLPLRTLVYPTKYAFNGACVLPVPFVVLSHRALLVQVSDGARVRNLLFNPTDTEAARATPYFAKMIERVGERATAALSKELGALEAQLAEVGLAPEDIDAVAYDHFHTQDLRPVLGTDPNAPVTGEARGPGRFPNALLLAPRREWDDWDHLHPFQKPWFVRDGRRGIDPSRVVLYDADLMIGEGCALLRTPGHTSGNQTLFVHGDQGIFGCSENGTSADNWSPYESSIPGLRSYARLYDAEVVLNANTPEHGAEQYTSMVVERSIVDRVRDRPAFVQMFPSSEVTASRIAPGITPAMSFGEVRSGTVQPRRDAT
jgi:glyoxylase-like metal-dependent hydrolase (beta-lactamase superfamily II)